MKTILFLNLLFALSFARAGSEGVGGGDLCENRIKIIRDDLSDWIKKGGPNGLVLPSEITIGQYTKTMLNQIEHGKIQCVSEGDEGYPVNIDGIAKVCRFDISSNESKITCDYNKFQSMKESDQYVLVHHEYAGMANLEIPNGADSNYFISNQISEYLVDQVVKKLSVKSQGPKNSPPKYQTVVYTYKNVAPGYANGNARDIALQDCMIKSEGNATCKILSHDADRTSTNKTVHFITTKPDLNQTPALLDFYHSPSNLIGGCNYYTAYAKTKAKEACFANSCNTKCTILQSVSVKVKGASAPENMYNFPWLSQHDEDTYCVHVTEVTCN